MWLDTTNSLKINFALVYYICAVSVKVCTNASLDYSES